MGLVFWLPKSEEFNQAIDFYAYITQKPFYANMLFYFHKTRSCYPHLKTSVAVSYRFCIYKIEQAKYSEFIMFTKR